MTITFTALNATKAAKNNKKHTCSSSVPIVWGEIEGVGGTKAQEESCDRKLHGGEEMRIGFFVGISNCHKKMWNEMTMTKSKPWNPNLRLPRVRRIAF
jgi:hypothetical protein